MANISKLYKVNSLCQIHHWSFLTRHAKSGCSNPPAGRLSSAHHYIAAIFISANDTAFLQGSRGAAQPRIGVLGMQPCVNAETV